MINAKKLLLALNIKSEPKETFYALDYTYNFSQNKRRIYLKCQIFKFYKGKTINKINVKGQKEAIIYLVNEMKLYA